MSFSDGMKKVVQTIKNMHEVHKMDKSVSNFKKMRETMKKINPPKPAAGTK